MKSIEIKKNRKTAVIYAYHQYDRNVRFFMRHGLVSDPKIDYYIVQNHAEWDHSKSTEMTEKGIGNSQVYWIHRPNISQDIGAYGSAVRYMDNQKYDFFVFVNSSMRGPFMPPWIKQDEYHWSRVFTDKLTDRVALVGSSINYHSGRPHVQSMTMAIDQRGFEIYRQNNLFMIQDAVVKKDDLIQRYEIGGSAAILAAGYNLDCLITALQGKDWRKKSQEWYPYDPKQYDFWGHRGYWGQNLHPYEVVFFKTNRPYHKNYNSTDLLTDWFEHNGLSHSADEILKDDKYIPNGSPELKWDKDLKKHTIIWSTTSSVLFVAVLVLLILWLKK